MEELCGWRLEGTLCGEATEGRGLRYAVSYSQISAEDRWLPLCERHARDLARGFTITGADGGLIDAPPEPTNGLRLV
jgi:hypothetical protein